MKNLLVLIVIAACVRYFFTHRKPAAPSGQPAPVPAAAASSTPVQPATTPTNFLKRPTDRAREVTEQVRKRSAEKF